MPQPKLSFDAALALALEACARQEQAALPSDGELRRLYPNLRRCDRRLRRALAERRRKEIRPRRVWPLRRVAVVAAACALLFAGALAPQADLFGAIYTALLQPDGRDYALRYTWEGEPAAATLPAGCAPAYQPPGYTADRDAAITTETEYYRQYTRTSAGRGARWYAVRLAVITADLQENYDGRSSVYTTLDLNNRTVQLGIQSDVWGDTIFTLFWETAGIHHTVQGNAPLTELIQVAESISYALPPRLRHGARNLSLES